MTQELRLLKISLDLPLMSGSTWGMVHEVAKQQWRLFQEWAHCISVSRCHLAPWSCQCCHAGGYQPTKM